MMLMSSLNLFQQVLASQHAQTRWAAVTLVQPSSPFVFAIILYENFISADPVAFKLRSDSLIYRVI